MIIWKKFKAKMPIFALIIVILFWILIGLVFIKLVDGFIDDF